LSISSFYFKIPKWIRRAERLKRGKIENVLNKIGMSHFYEGYNYIVEESLLINKQYNMHKKIILNDLNRDVANMFSTSTCSIERAIRTCIDGTFLHGNIGLLNQIFEYYASYYDSRPSNKLFLTTIVNYLNTIE
jgi:hypothetical protein